jgi:PAS domain S-box-containing protein
VGDAVEGATPETLFTGDSEIAVRLRSLDWSQTSLGAVETWSDDLKTAVQILLKALDQAQQREELSLTAPLHHDRTVLDALQLAAQADAFRAMLTNALRPLTDANEIQAMAARLLGESLGASRVIYVEVLPNSKEVIVHKNYTQDVASLSGLYRLEDFGRNLADDHQAGQPAIVPDVANHSKYTADEKARYRAIEIAAHIDVPLIKHNHFVALLAVHHNIPRQWTEDEVKRVEETAEQTWAAVERARAETLSRESRIELERQWRKFDAIAAAIPDFIYTFDLTGRFTYISPALLNLLQKTPVEALGKNFFELDYPTDLATRLQQQIQHVITTCQPIKDETPYTSALGTRAYEHIFVPLLGVDGAVEAVAGVTRDITDRKQTEEALRFSEQRFRDMADNASMMIWVTDTTGYCTYLSRSWYDFSGQTEAEGLGFGWLNVVHPDDREASKAVFLSANECQDAFQVEYRLRRQDGVYRTCIDTARPWFGVDGAFKGYIGSVIDIDDRNQTETALRQSEERYRTLFDSIDEGFCIIEVLFDEHDTPIDYRFLEINPAFEQQTGLQHAVGQTAHQLVPDLEDRWVQIYGQVALTGEPARFENGSEAMERWFDVYACRMGEPEGRKVAIVFKDISEQQAALRERKRAEELLRRTAELNAFRVSLTDALRPLADLVEIQATASRVLGEYLGANRVVYFELHGTDYVVERDYAHGVPPLAGRYPIDSFGSELLAAFCAGHTVSTPDLAAESSLSPEQRAAYAAIQIGAYLGIPLVKGGEFVAGLAIHSASPRVWSADEISLVEEVAERTWAAIERIQVEAALRDSENRFRMAIESAQLGTWDWNLVTNQLIWDERCKAMFGLPPEAESSIEVFFAGLHPDDRDRLEQVVQWTLNPASGGLYNTEYRTIGIQDRAERWVAARGQAYFDAANKPQRFVGTVLNITAQKQIEVEREQLLAREQAAREAADRANRIKDEFLAVLSHELRSPLNPILGWSKLLQQGKLDATKTAIALETIERNAQLQVQLIDDLLDISRILRGKLSLTVTPVDLSAVITAALETVRLAADVKAIHIQTTALPGVGIVLGDAGRLQQVVWNLLSNAVKFTPNGGRVEVRLEQVGKGEGGRGKGEALNHSRLPTPDSPSFAQIQVTDTGKGIRSSFLPYVFEHFRQEDSATTRQFGGLGLGLAIARQIVELHGGTIVVDSPGETQGATFTVCIPLALRPHAVPAPERAPDAVKDLSGIHILVVDDDTDSREFLSFVLEQVGAIVTTVASGTEAVLAIAQRSPDILISDIGMPEMDGYMLLRHLRRLPPEHGGKIPAIALTAYAGELDQQQAIAAGFQYHLAKPIPPESVIATVAACLSSI